MSWWCHPTISFSVIPFSYCSQSFPTSGSFPVSQFFLSGGQSIEASASVLVMNIQGWFPLVLTGLISWLSKGLSRVFSSTTVQKYQFFSIHLLYSVQLLSCVWLFMTPQTAAGQASLSIANSLSLLKLMSIESVMPSNDLILQCPLLLLPSIFPRNKVFSSESHQVDKVLELQLQHQSFQWIFWLISFRIDWVDLLAVQGTLKSLLQHHSLKASILRSSAFFMVQLSHPYMTTGKTKA